MVHIRPAETHEAGKLTSIAIKSEAYWGYDPEFMKNFEEIYKVTEDFIRENPTFVMQEEDTVVGFYAVIAGEKQNELEYFYIEPQRIGKGYGKIMWNHLEEYCMKLGMRDIEMVTSPQARAFYERMGAVHVAEVESFLRKGRMIPRLRYSF